MDYVTLVGTLAGGLTTVSFVPQVMKTWKTGCARDISLSMFLLFSCGVLLWLIYGILLQQPPIIIANCITLALSTIILFMKARDLLSRRRALRVTD